MAKRKIFISSVQAEFAQERKALHEYIVSDPLLGRFFEPFLFELLPAIDQGVETVYLREVEYCDIYLGILGKNYGFENENGISPTELEFDHATKHHKTRLLFLSAHSRSERHPKEEKFILKAQKVLVRKQFLHIDELKSAVYASLVRYLEEKEIIRVGPFDATLHATAGLSDLSEDKIRSFVRLARSKRGFPLYETESSDKVLTHLNLANNGRITNSAILLFGNEPQRFFINSEVRCAYFHGTIVSKPIPSYKVFKGSVFELVEQSVDFVLSKLDYSVGTRAKEVQIPGGYEIPKEIVAEAIVNSVAHRDYTSNASVQVMLFADRLEIWNPGSLPLGWTTEKLKQLHTSVPANPLLAEPMYLAGYIERLGTGTSDIVRLALGAGLKEPEFVQDEIFRTIIYRPRVEGELDPQEVKEQVGEQVKEQVGEQVKEQVKEIIRVIIDEMSVHEIMLSLNLKGRRNFLQNYLQPALEMEFIEMTQPKSPNSPTQKYRLTTKGATLKEFLKTKK
jgi:ATP-dependent DNA helicase RecG